jgi:Na+/melibiose symporter-like transporter
VLLASGLTAIMLALTEANRLGWTDPRIVAGFAGGPLFLGAFWLVELRRAAPLVDVRLFRNRTFTMACVSAFLFSAAVFGSQPFTSLFMQNYLGLSPLEGGLAFVPATALVAALTPFSGVIGQRLGHRLRLLIIAGSCSVGISFVYLLRLDTGSGYADGLLPAFVLRGLGIGLVMSSASLAVMSAVPLARSGLASGTLTMFRQAGTAVGVALMGAVFLRHIHSDLTGQLASVPASEAAAVEASAAHFLPTGEGEVRAATEDSIVEGFVLLAMAAVAISAAAALAALFVRHRLEEEPVAQPATLPADPGPVPAGGN